MYTHLVLHFVLSTWRQPLFAVLALLFAMGACAQTIEGNAQGPDAGSAPSNRADAGLPDAAPDAGPQALTLRAGTDDSLVAENSISCNDNSNGEHTDNSYYRTYPLATMGVNSDFLVTSVEFGIEVAEGQGGTQPLQVSLYTLTGSFLLANLTLLASTTVTVADQTASVLEVPITTTVPAGSTLVAEVFTPDGQSTNNSFFIGSNRLAEGSPSFLRASQCDVNEPTAVNGLGVDGLIMSIVLNVKGTHIP